MVQAKTGETLNRAATGGLTTVIARPGPDFLGWRLVRGHVGAWGPEGGSMTASASQQAAQKGAGRRRGCSRTTIARHSTAQPGPGRRGGLDESDPEQQSQDLAGGDERRARATHWHSAAQLGSALL